MDNISPELHLALTEFGLSAAEIQVYLQSLALGPRPATILAQKSGLKRGTTYNVLNSLLEKGIAQEFMRGGVKQFVCSAPSTLLSRLDQRVTALHALTGKLKEVIPELEQIRSPTPCSPKVRFFHGIEGIREAMDEILESDEKQIRAILDLKENWTTLNGANYSWVQRFIDRRVELGMWYYGIVNHWDPDDYIIRLQKEHCRELRLADGSEFPAELMICGDKVVLISAVRERMGIIIESEAIAKTLSSMHALLWNQLEQGKNSGSAEGIADLLSIANDFIGQQSLRSHRK